MRSAIALALALPLAAALPAPAQVVPPPETLRRAEAALGLLDGRGFAGTYRITTRTHVVATGEDGPEDALEVEEVTVAADGTRTARLVRAVEDGRDVTEKRLAEKSGESGAVEEQDPAKHAGQDRERGSAASRDELDLELVPLGVHASRYAFTPGRVRDGVATAAFAPRAKAGEDDELGRGEVAWDAASGDPLWIEAGLAEKRTGLSELVLRFEFARAGGVLYPRVIHTRTRAGIPLLFKLRLRIDIEISDLRPAAAPQV